MKRIIAKFSFVIMVFVALAFLESCTNKTDEKPKEYKVILSRPANFEKDVSRKLAEGWSCQGGPYQATDSLLGQAMIK